MTEMLTLPLLPVYLTDSTGAILMLAFSLAAFLYARRLRRLEPKNFLWSFFFWLTITLIALAVSRSLWHLLRYIFMLNDMRETWSLFAPYSGSINSLAFFTVALVTFFYHNTEQVLAMAHNDEKTLRVANRELEKAHSALHQLNLTLEQRVEKRTRELRLSETKFRSLFEASKDMIFFCDQEGRIADINDSGLELLGFTCREDAIGQPLAEFFLDKEKYQQYQETLLLQGHVKDFESQFKGPGATTLYLMLTATAIRNEIGAFQGCEAIAIDLSHFKEVTDQLIQSEKMTSVGQLAAGVAHEINTPLGIILGYSQLLAEDFEENREVHETLSIIEKHAKICRRIVADLLKFSRPSTEQKMRHENINRCMDDVLSIIEHTLNMDHIYIHRKLADDLPMTLVDPERLRQVFVNLLTNSHHAIGREGIVGIWSRYLPLGDEVEIIIADTGAGIPPVVMTRIFDPFFTTKGVGKGTGLGLSVSFGIIKDHKGRIEAYSPPRSPELLAADMRTAFHIFLPVSRDNQTEE